MKIVSAKNMFLIKNLFYIYKEKRSKKYFIVIEDKHYQIFKYSIEDLEKSSDFRHSVYIRFFTIPTYSYKSTTSFHFRSSIRFMKTAKGFAIKQDREDLAGKSYVIVPFSQGAPPDILLNRYSFKKLYEFMQTTPIKTITVEE